MYDFYFISNYVNLCSFQKYSLTKQFDHIATNIATPSSACKSVVNVYHSSQSRFKLENTGPKSCKLIICTT